MKNLTMILSVAVLMLAASCAQEEKSPLEGAWDLVYSEWPGHNLTFPDRIQGSSIKFFSKEHFAYAGKLNIDDVPMHFLGGGRYILDGNRYSEMIDYHRSEDIIGTTVRILIEIRGDTLIQKWPADDDWVLDDWHNVQKYVRME